MNTLIQKVTRRTLSISLCLCVFVPLPKNKNMSHHIHSYLALGDSYTIGEGLPLHENFPYQLVQLLRAQSLHFYAPEIIAKTGWTTGELAEHLLHHQLNEKYDFVTLLIGVNNQYRGLSMEDYKTDFEFLLKKAIHFTGGIAEHVFVLSIPDYSKTPFAKGMDTSKIEAGIDAFNKLNKEISEQQKVHYINITEGTKKAGKDKKLLAADGLHYSASEYKIWAEELANAIVKLVKHRN